jgi:hypothetical protein
MQVELGQEVKDSITGFFGLATGRVEYITGCNQVLVQPQCKPDGEYIENRWFDEDRLSVINGTVFALPRATANGPDKPAPRR